MGKAIKILLVEDDPNLGSVLRDYLSMKGFDTTLAKDGEIGLSNWQTEKFDLAILDVMMPKKDGFTLAKEIRKIDEKLPLIFLTAKSMIEDKIEGFSIGADDYLTKPFSMEELILRIKARLKRNRFPKEGPAPLNEIFQIGKYIFDYTSRTLNFGIGAKENLTSGESNPGSKTQDTKTGKQITSREAELLRLLCLHQNDLLKRQTALMLIWGDDSYFNSRSMDVFITKLRKHLKKDPDITILNVHGSGFKLIV